MATIPENLNDTLTRIEAACRAAGRPVDSVALLVVSKTQEAAAIRQAHAAGSRSFGANYVQEALDKIAGFNPPDIRWHLLGHLQSNKAKKAAPAFAMIQSVDSVDLLQRLDGAAEEAGARPALLIQIDLAGEWAPRYIPKAAPGL